MTRSINRPMIALLLIMALLGPATATAQTPPPPISIGQVQGAVGNSADGDTHRSSFALPAGNGTGQTVTIQGVIYQKTLSRSVNSSGVSSLNGFFIQNAPDSPDSAGRPDGDPNTSDGIFVFTGGSTTLIDGYRPTVGDEVRISGRVSEFFSLTQLSSARLVGSVVRSNVDLGAALPPFETDPPDELADAERYWERREGMRAQVPAGSIVLNGRNVFAGALDGEVWLARGDSAIAQRSDRYARRAFRDPHPLDNDPTLFDDGNGYRILLGSQGIKAAENNRDALIAPSRTYDSVTNAPIGGVSFSFSKYQVQVGQQLQLSQGVDPASNAPPEAPNHAREYSLATFNVENLYDFRDDPNDDCDFGGNRGCLGVSPPFDYVPSSDAEYRKRLAQIAEQIVRDLHGPDLILIQEAEDQDICTVDGGTLSCGSANDRDGKPDTLQELAVVIKSSSGPTYEAAFDRDGADDRGIVSAYLYRADRVELLPARQDDPVLGRDPRIAYRSPGLAYNDDVQNPKALNAGLPADVDRSTGTDGNDVFTRAPQVGLFRVWRDRIGASVFTDLYLLDNHFSSTPDRRVGQRREQAAYNAAIVAAVQAANPEARVVVGGDLNVYPRPDDPFGPPNTSDQLRALYERPMTNLWERLVAEVPAAAYSYVFQGQTQTLDQIFVTSSLLRELIQVRAAHINSDWPAEHDDGARGTSDHDPPVARFSGLPTIDRLQALVRFLETRGDITGQNTVRQLLDHLERAGRERGRSGEAQLRAFINQARGAAPQSLTQAAADILARETELLIESLDEQETRRQAADGASRQDENRDRARSSRTNTTQDSDEHRDRNLSPDRTRGDDDRSGT